MTASAPTRTDFNLVAIPLRRPEASAFLRDWQVPARGATVAIVEQRPSSPARDRWLDGLAVPGRSPSDLVDRLLATDDPMAHVGTTTTDRLVPRHFLDQDSTWLERNLGGWSPLWFGPMAVIDHHRPEADPLLAASETIVEYGRRIPAAGVAHDLVTRRLDAELPGGPDRLARGAAMLRDIRHGGADATEDLVRCIRGQGPLADVLDPLLAHDELIEHLTRLELRRRAAAAEDRADVQQELAARQERIAQQWGIRLLLKGEYVMGRHRRSTVLLAEGLGVVVKQPAPEPQHAIDLGIRTHGGLDENWPHAVGSGAIVTPRGALGNVVDSTAVEQLDEAFGRDVQFATSLGLTVEPFESGPTLADLAVRRPHELTARRYDEILVHQLACEELGVDNPDWHAANFMVTGAGLVHVDWGAARPIAPEDATPTGARARLDQVRELAWSFQDEALAQATVDLHARATEHPDNLERLRRRARAIVGTS